MLNCEEPLIMNDWSDVAVKECIINTEAFTQEEIQTVIKNFINNKGPGEDMIASEMCKVMGNCGFGRLHN